MILYLLLALTSWPAARLAAPDIAPVRAILVYGSSANHKWLEVADGAPYVYFHLVNGSVTPPPPLSGRGCYHLAVFSDESRATSSRPLSDLLPREAEVEIVYYPSRDGAVAMASMWRGEGFRTVTVHEDIARILDAAATEIAPFIQSDEDATCEAYVRARKH